LASPPIEILQVVPISEREKQFVQERSVHAFEQAMVANLAALLDVDARAEFV